MKVLTRGRQTGSKLGKGLLALAALLAITAAPKAVNAQVVYDTFGVGDSYNTGTGWTIAGQLSWSQQAAMAFTPSASGQLSSIEVAMGLVSGPNQFEVELLSDAGGQPGSVIESWVVSGQMGSFGANNAPVLIASALAPMLSVGTAYWVSISADANTWAAWNLNTVGANAGAAFGPAGGPYSVAGTNTQSAFRVSVSPNEVVPEPSSVALLIGGGAGCFAMMRRRRSTK